MRKLIWVIFMLAGTVAFGDLRVIEDAAEKGDQMAIASLRDSAHCGNPRAMNFLGYLYWQGRGTRMDKDSALYFLNAAAELGDAKAMGNLAHLMLIGDDSFVADTVKGICLLSSAAERNSMAALRELSDFLDYTSRYDSLIPSGIKRVADAYSHGYPLPYDYHKSIRLYDRAAMAGDTISQRIVDEVRQIFPDL